MSLYVHIAQKELGTFEHVGKRNALTFAEWSNIAEQNFDKYFKEAVDIIRRTVIEGTNGKSIATLTKSTAFHKRLIAKVQHSPLL